MDIKELIRNVELAVTCEPIMVTEEQGKAIEALVVAYMAGAELKAMEPGSLIPVMLINKLDDIWDKLVVVEKQDD